MNVLFLSPFFPPNAHLFCRALSARGATVLGVGDEPASGQSPEVIGSLHEYAFEPRMGEYERLRDAVAGLVARHGALHRLDSNGEHWLEFEGRLRDDFGVPGLSSARVAELRSKIAMAAGFRAAGAPYPPTVSARSPGTVRGMASEYGFPLVFKPDSGSGAVDTFIVADSAGLEAALARSLREHVVQPFVRGDIATFDGLTDADGRVVFCTSHTYDTGILQVREGSLDGHYYSLRDIPPALEHVGRHAVAAFDIRERFFHLEFFSQPDGSYVGLELNVRPPGGYTTDMMSAACAFDVYDLWARVCVGDPPRDFVYTRAYHTAHAGRRSERRYRLSHDQLERELGELLFAVKRVPDAYAATMGNVAYLIRSPDLQATREAIALVQEPAASSR